MQILLIDDNIRLSELYREILTYGGYITKIQNNSALALQTIHEVKPDLLLLDLMMEPLSGWDVLNQVRRDPEWKELPVIILTGQVLTIDEAIRYGLEIDGFIMKPLERSMLISVIKEIEEIIHESDERFSRAISSGLPPEQAKKCRDIIKKRKMLIYLKQVLEKQEQLLSSLNKDNHGIQNSTEELRVIITKELSEIDKIKGSCP